MIKLVRDINTLTKRQRLLVGLVNCAISIVIILLIDRSQGVRLQTSIFNIAITLIVGAGVLYWYSYIQKIREKRKGLSNGP